jgi:hypothetical protein
LTPIFARVRNPLFDGWPPWYRVVVASPKFGRFLRIDLFWLDCRPDEEEFAPECASAVASNVAARRARVAKRVAERLANVLTGDLRVHLDKAVKELEFVEDILSSKRTTRTRRRCLSKVTTVARHDRFSALSVVCPIWI